MFSSTSVGSILKEIVLNLWKHCLISENIRFGKKYINKFYLLFYHVQSEYGTILKALSTTNKSLQGCYLEEIRILPEGHIGPVKSLKILQRDRSLFVGLDDRLVKVPLERCSNYLTERYGAS